MLMLDFIIALISSEELWVVLSSILFMFFGTKYSPVDKYKTAVVLFILLLLSSSFPILFYKPQGLENKTVIINQAYKLLHLRFWFVLITFIFVDKGRKKKTKGHK